MKKVFVLIFALAAFWGFAQDASSEEKESGIPGFFSLTADFAYYPKAAPVAVGSPDDGLSRFAPSTHIYSGVEARVTGKYSYVIPTPFGDNPLVKGNNVTLTPALELTPVSLAPQFFVSFTPIAFLRFTASAQVGTGWEFIGIQGMGELDNAVDGYDSLTPFKHYFYEFKWSNLFQFDLGAVLPGDWTHVVMQASYDIMYTGLSGVSSGTPWIWQASGEKVTGWNYYSNIIVGYQMPLVLQTVGCQFELSGYYDKHSFDSVFSDWNPTFMKVCINPVFILQFTKKDALTIQFRFASRRGFSEKAGDAKTAFALDYNGREWFFDRIALSYNHVF